MPNQIVVPTGYMGSGSSAITDLLREIQGYDCKNETFEYVLMHCPDGVFDLEDKLLFGNNAIRSDEAIHRFIECINMLYDRKNYWISSYKKKISPSFQKYSKEYISKITTATFPDTYWYFQENPDTFLLQLKNYICRVVCKITSEKIKLSRPLKYKSMNIAFPVAEDFYMATKRYLQRIFDDLGYRDSNLVLDQFLLPHNLYRIENYFDDNLRVIVVDRDPRDVFVLNKYKWTPDKMGIPYPLDALDFSEFYKKMRRNERFVDDKRILRIHFEDLVYKYDEVIGGIYTFLGIDDSFHLNKRKYFNPNISIENTHLCHLNSMIEMECNVIAKELEEYIYEFPDKSNKHKNLNTVF